MQHPARDELRAPLSPSIPTNATAPTQTQRSGQKWAVPRVRGPGPALGHVAREQRALVLSLQGRGLKIGKVRLKLLRETPGLVRA